MWRQNIIEHLKMIFPQFSFSLSRSYRQLLHVYVWGKEFLMENSLWNHGKLCHLKILSKPNAEIVFPPSKMSTQPKSNLPFQSIARHITKIVMKIVYNYVIIFSTNQRQCEWISNRSIRIQCDFFFACAYLVQYTQCLIWQKMK